MHIFSLNVLPAIICDMICDLVQEGHSLYQLLAIFVITRSSRGFIPCQYHVDFIQIHDVHWMELCHSVKFELQGYLIRQHWNNSYLKFILVSYCLLDQDCVLQILKNLRQSCWYFRSHRMVFNKKNYLYIKPFIYNHINFHNYILQPSKIKHHCHWLIKD